MDAKRLENCNKAFTLGRDFAKKVKADPVERSKDKYPFWTGQEIPQLEAKKLENLSGATPAHLKQNFRSGFNREWMGIS